MFLSGTNRIDRLVRRGKGDALVRLTGKKKQAVRLKALEGMGRLGGKTCFERAVKCLSDPDPAIRCAAAGALARMDGEKAAPVIAEQLRSESDPQVRHHLRSLINS